MDGKVDKIWLFDCGTEEMKNQFSRLTIVDESMDYSTVRVGFAVEEGHEGLEDCLQSQTDREKSWKTKWMDDDSSDDEDKDWQVSKPLKYTK